MCWAWVPSQAKYAVCFCASPVLSPSVSDSLSDTRGCFPRHLRLPQYRVLGLEVWQTHVPELLSTPMLCAASYRTLVGCQAELLFIVNHNVRQAIILILEVERGSVGWLSCSLVVRAVGTQMRTQVSLLVKSPTLPQRKGPEVVADKRFLFSQLTSLRFSLSWNIFSYVERAVLW